MLQRSSPWKTSAYLVWNISERTDFRIVSWISRWLGQMSFKIDRLALAIGAERLVLQVDVHRAGQGVGDDQRRRGQVVGPHLGVDPALEVAVAGEDGDGDQVVFLDRLGDRGRQRARVADAGRAAVADQVEAELVEVRVEPGVLEVVGDDLRAGSQAGLDPGLGLEPVLDGLLGQQARRRPSPTGSTCWCSS